MFTQSYVNKTSNTALGRTGSKHYTSFCSMFTLQTDFVIIKVEIQLVDSINELSSWEHMMSFYQSLREIK